MINQILETLHGRFAGADIRCVVLDAEFNPTWSFWMQGKEIPDSRFSRVEINAYRMIHTEAEIVEMVVERVSSGFRQKWRRQEETGFQKTGVVV